MSKCDSCKKRTATMIYKLHIGYSRPREIPMLDEIRFCDTCYIRAIRAKKGTDTESTSGDLTGTP